MKNEINWITGENGSFPMILDEKGLGLKGFSKFFFYFCGIISMLSMFWVIVVSIGVYAATNQDPTTPEYYKMVSIGSIALSLFCINSFIKFYKEKKNYFKHVEIDEHKIKYLESNKDNTKPIEWEEKLKKYQSIELRHFNYRGVSSWYIYLKHPNREHNVALFTPEYNYQNADENTKRETLDFYGKLFNLPTNYLTLEESYKAANPEEDKK